LPHSARINSCPDTLSRVRQIAGGLLPAVLRMHIRFIVLWHAQSCVLYMPLTSVILSEACVNAHAQSKDPDNACVAYAASRRSRETLHSCFDKPCLSRPLKGTLFQSPQLSRR
jgi:hypothetical protein